MAVKTTACALLLVFIAGLAVRAEILEQILVKVNGEIFTKTDLEQRQIQALRQRNRAVTPEDLENDETLRRALEEVTPGLLVDAVDEMLVMQQGRERGYRMGDEQFASILERIRKENKLEDDETFENALKQEGLTLAELRKQLERQMVMSRIQGDAVGKVSVTEEEERAYYAEHAGEFTTPSSITIREILIEVAPTTDPGGQPSVNVGADDAAKAEAEALRARVVGGEDFSAVASQESDSASKANGGLIGPLSLDELAPALKEIIAPMTVGDITQAIRTQRGYQLFKLESATPTTVLPFEDAREQIAEKVYGQKRGVALRAFLSKLRGQAIIEWKNEEAQKLYEKALATTPSQQPSL
jgi:peptidyl-prolyl cis-trans isomerase SurA